MFSRREFVGGAFATGFLSLAANADAEGSASVAGGDEVLKRMNLTRRTVHVGLAKPFSVVHASDSHIVRVSAADLGVMDEKAVSWYESRRAAFANGIFGLAAAVSYARKESLPLFHTGDLIDFASRANHSGIRQDMDGVDWFYACGNHEFQGWNGGVPAIAHGTSKAARESGRRAYEKFLPNPIPVASRIIGGVNFVQYDNGGFSDYLAPQQFETVKAEFAKGLPVVLLCHMPFWSEAVGEEILRTHKGLTKDRIDTGYVQGRPDKPNWGGRLEMTEWLRKQEQLKAVLCGHLHHDFTDDFSPTAKQYVAAANYRGAVYRYDFV